MYAVQASALCAVALGLCMGEAGVSIMHDVNHCAGLRSRSARYVLGTAMDLVSARLAAHVPAWRGAMPTPEIVASSLELKDAGCKIPFRALTAWIVQQAWRCSSHKYECQDVKQGGRCGMQVGLPFPFFLERQQYVLGQALS